MPLRRRRGLRGAPSPGSRRSTPYHRRRGLPGATGSRELPLWCRLAARWFGWPPRRCRPTPHTRCPRCAAPARTTTPSGRERRSRQSAASAAPPPPLPPSPLPSPIPPSGLRTPPSASQLLQQMNSKTNSETHERVQLALHHSRHFYAETSRSVSIHGRIKWSLSNYSIYRQFDFCFKTSLIQTTVTFLLIIIESWLIALFEALRLGLTMADVNGVRWSWHVMNGRQTSTTVDRSSISAQARPIVTALTLAQAREFRGRASASATRLAVGKAVTVSVTVSDRVTDTDTDTVSEWQAAGVFAWALLQGPTLLD